MLSIKLTDERRAYLRRLARDPAHGALVAAIAQAVADALGEPPPAGGSTRKSGKNPSWLNYPMEGQHGEQLAALAARLFGDERRNLRAAIDYALAHAVARALVD